MGFVIAAVALVSAEARHQRFLELLRTYPERAPAETFAQVEQLIEEGDFDERDRAEYWLGSARLAAGELDTAESWFRRVAKEHPATPFGERAVVGLADIAARRQHYRDALELYGHAASARDPSVRELARIGAAQVRVLRRHQTFAILALVIAMAVALWYLFRSGARGLWPPPAEIRFVAPVLVLLSVMAFTVDAAPRQAALEICGAGAVLVWLSGAGLRARSSSAPGRALHAALGVVALGCVAYVALYSTDLLGMVAETFRAGPE